MAERAERRLKRRELREEQRVVKAAAEAQLSFADTWANDDPRWAALEDDIFYTTADDSDFSSGESDFKLV